MKPISVVDAYTTKFSHSLFLKNISEILMSIEKIYCDEFRELLSQQLLFEVSLFMISFASALQYLDYYYNEYPLKQTAVLYLKLLLKTAFFNVFLLFLET